MTRDIGAYSMIIDIKGLRGSGKTTAALAIVQMLRKAGMTVVYRAADKKAEEEFEKYLAHFDISKEMTKSNLIVVTDKDAIES